MLQIVIRISGWHVRRGCDQAECGVLMAYYGSSSRSGERAASSEEREDAEIKMETEAE